MKTISEILEDYKKEYPKYECEYDGTDRIVITEILGKHDDEIKKHVMNKRLLRDILSIQTPGILKILNDDIPVDEVDNILSQDGFSESKTWFKYPSNNGPQYVNGIVLKIILKAIYDYRCNISK